MKKIITHINPDLDAVASVWLIKRFLPGWEEALVDFKPAVKAKNVDINPDILYVDVGGGRLDHHQTGEYLSAAKLCWDYIKKSRRSEKLSPLEKKALENLVAVVTQVDNARDLSWPEVGENRFKFYLHSIIADLRGLGENDEGVMDFGFKVLDAVLLGLKSKLKAEEELAKGIKFKTAWGEAVALETGNEKVLWQGEVQGYSLVVRKDPESGGVRIYGRYDKDIDLTKAYNKFKKLDPNSDWFLHASKKLLLNQSEVNFNMRPTKLNLEKIIEVLKGGVKRNGDCGQERSR